MSENNDNDLSSQEVEIMSFVKAGLSAKEISLKVNRNQRTVEKHLISVKSKLNAKNIAHAVALYMEKHQSQHFSDVG